MPCVVIFPCDNLPTASATLVLRESPYPSALVVGVLPLPIRRPAYNFAQDSLQYIGTLSSPNHAILLATQHRPGIKSNVVIIQFYWETVSELQQHASIVD